MKSKHNLIIEKIEKMSHQDARAQSFKVTIKPKDKERALSSESWPHGVRVQLFRQKRSFGGREPPAQLSS